MLLVFFDHQLIGEFPAGHHQLLARDWHPEGLPAAVHPEDLYVVAGGRVVHRYPHGTWHAAGVPHHGQVLCGFVDPDDSCPRCDRGEVLPALIQDGRRPKGLFPPVPEGEGQKEGVYVVPDG